MNPNKRPTGRPKGVGKTTELLRTLNIGDSILLPPAITDAALIQVARNRFYNPAKRLGIGLDFVIDNGNIRVTRTS